MKKAGIQGPTPLDRRTTLKLGGGAGRAAPRRPGGGRRRGPPPGGETHTSGPPPRTNRPSRTWPASHPPK